MPSFILIHPTVWPQYTNVTERTDRQDRQRSDSIGRTVLQTVAQKRFAICYWTVVLFILSVCDFGVFGQTVGWITVPLGSEVSLGPGHIVIDEDPASPERVIAPNFRSMSVVAKRLGKERKGVYLYSAFIVATTLQSA